MTDPTRTDSDNYKYDIAFSFLAGDEDLALELDKNLKSRLSTFVYTRKQEELAGKDGEEAFNSVFETESRIVVVLYRADWGTTPFTRIEQTAIRNRGYEEGYDFALFINLDPEAGLPKWLPKNKLWFGFERYGLDGALSVIEARVQEAGGSTRPETFEERTTRVAGEMKTEKARKEFLESGEGVNAASGEFESLAEILKKKVAFARDTSGIDINIGHEGYSIGIACGTGSRGGGVVGLAIDWRPQFGNSLADAYLEFRTWDGLPPNVGDSHMWDPPTRRSQERFEFDRRLSEFGWRGTRTDETFRNSENFANFAIEMIIEEARSRQ